MTTRLVVTATDGSGESLRAVEWAAGEAVLHAVPLRIVSAAAPPPRMTGLQVRPDRDHVADLIRSERNEALDAAASRAARVAPGLVIVTDPLNGPPAQAVTETGYGASMLVVGSRGTGAFSAMMLGSVSRYVAGHAACPVVIVRDPVPVRSGQVAVGIGDPDDGDSALTFAFEEARLRKVGLMAVHACYLPQASLSRAGSAWPLPGPVEPKRPGSWRRCSTRGGRSTPTSRSARMSCRVTRAGPWPACRPGSAWSSSAGAPAIRGCRGPARSGTRS
jgi:nucleotide-binding universal stress UspA family protein